MPLLLKLVAAALLAFGNLTAVAQSLRPDLKLSLYDLSPKEAKPGQRIEVTDETRNVGNSAATTTVCEFWLGPRSDSITGAVKLDQWTKNVENLAPNRTFVRPIGSRHFTIPAGVTNRGPQFVIGILRRVTAESNLANNTNAVALTILAP